MRNLLRLILLSLMVFAFVGGFIFSSLRNEHVEPSDSPLTVKFTEEENAAGLGKGSKSEPLGISRDKPDFFVDIASGPDLAEVIQRSREPVPKQQDLRLFCTSDPEIWQPLPTHHDVVLIVRSGPGFGEQAQC